MMTMTITRHDLEVALNGPAVLVAGPNGPEWVTDYTLYAGENDDTILAHRGNGTFDEVLCGPEVFRDLAGDGPWTIGVATSAQEVDAILFRGKLFRPR